MLNRTSSVPVFFSDPDIEWSVDRKSCDASSSRRTRTSAAPEWGAEASLGPKAREGGPAIRGGNLAAGRRRLGAERQRAQPPPDERGPAAGRGAGPQRRLPPDEAGGPQAKKRTAAYSTTARS